MSGSGTVPYAAPEVLHNAVVEQKADVYSLGVVLLECFGRWQTLNERSRVLDAFQAEPCLDNLPQVFFRGAASRCQGWGVNFDRVAEGIVRGTKYFKREWSVGDTNLFVSMMYSLLLTLECAWQRKRECGRSSIPGKREAWGLRYCSMRLPCPSFASIPDEPTHAMGAAPAGLAIHLVELCHLKT